MTGNFTGNRRDETERCRRIHVHLYESDIEEIKIMFGRSIGFNKAVRMMVRKYFSYLKAKAAENADAKLKEME